MNIMCSVIFNASKIFSENHSSFYSKSQENVIFLENFLKTNHKGESRLFTKTLANVTRLSMQQKLISNAVRHAKLMLCQPLTLT